MRREVRRAPKDWEHPCVNGRYQPMFDKSFREANKEYLADKEAWGGGNAPTGVRKTMTERSKNG